MVGRCGLLPGPRFNSLAFSRFGVSATDQPAIPFPAADYRPKSPLFHVILPVLKEFSGIPGSMTGQSVATAPPNSVSLGSLASWLPPALGGTIARCAGRRYRRDFRRTSVD